MTWKYEKTDVGDKYTWEFPNQGSITVIYDGSEVQIYNFSADGSTAEFRYQNGRKLLEHNTPAGINYKEIGPQTPLATNYHILQQLPPEVREHLKGHWGITG